MFAYQPAVKANIPVLVRAEHIMHTYKNALAELQTEQRDIFELTEFDRIPEKEFHYKKFFISDALGKSKLNRYLCSLLYH